jgi:hypothetical protein
MAQHNRVDEIIKLIDDALAENERARHQHNRPRPRPEH